MDKGLGEPSLVRRIVVVCAAVVVLLCIGFVAFSGAVFTSGSTSNVRATTDTIQNWLHVYSQSTDPNGLTGYYIDPSDGLPAGTGIDATASIGMGHIQSRKNTICRRTLTIATPTSFPTGTSCTITATLVADPATGQQPINKYGFGNISTSNTYTNPITLNAGQKYQLNIRVNPPAALTYQPTIVLTVTYTGYTGSYYQYSIPVSISGY